MVWFQPGSVIILHFLSPNTIKSDYYLFLGPSQNVAKLHRFDTASHRDGTTRAEDMLSLTLFVAMLVSVTPPRLLTELVFLSLEMASPGLTAAD